MIKVTFLGTNGWYSTDTGVTLCTLVESDDFYIILDAGEGLSRIDRYVVKNKPIYIFLSHFHLDHIIGLHTLCKNDFPQGVKICGPIGIEETLKKVITPPFTGSFSDLNFPVEFVELNDGVNDIGFNVTAKELVHASCCFGYRLELDDKVIAYCTDTGPCENISMLSQSADLAIYECSLLPDEVNDDWPHLNPKDSAKAALESSVKKMVMTHFNPLIYKTILDRERAVNDAKEVFKDVVLAKDGASLVLD